MGLNLLVLGSRVVLFVYASSMRASRELETVAFELTTERNRTHRGGVPVQEVDLFEGQSLGLKKKSKFLDHHQGTNGLTSGTQK